MFSNCSRKLYITGHIEQLVTPQQSPTETPDALLITGISGSGKTTAHSALRKIVRFGGRLK